MRKTGNPGTAIRSRSQDKNINLAGGVIFLALIIFSSLIVGCSGTQTPPAQAGPQFTIQRLAPSVFMGEADPLPEITVDDAQDFPLNFLATTGQDGEAVVKGELEGASCSIFIFFDTRLERSACNKAASDGNTTCLEEGSAVFENCHNHLVQTASGEVKLLGTWASVTYLSDQKLTLLAVTEGETSVQPVLDETTGSMGSQVSVGAGEYYYSAPDQDMNPVAGAPPRQAIPLSEVGPVLDVYPQASAWFTQAMDRSKEYGVDPAQFGPLPTVTAMPTAVPLPTVPSLSTSVPLPTIVPAGLVVVPGIAQADSPLVDGSCQDGAYRQAYTSSFEVGRQERATIYLLQDENRFYVCAAYPAGFPAAGRISLRLDPQGDGNLYPWADLSDYQLSLDASTGKAETWTRPGSGGYVGTDKYHQDWSGAVARTDERQLAGVEFATDIKAFVLGPCGHPFGLTLFNGEIPGFSRTYGWPDNADANSPKSWQSAVLEHPSCPDQPEGRIAFTCQLNQREDDQQICMVSSSGSGYRQLTYETGFSHGFPSFAPDGNSLVYVSNRTGTYEIYELDLANYQETQLTENLGNLAAPAISPQGDRIVFTNRNDFAGQPNEGNSVWMMGRAGEEPHRLVGLPWGYAWDPVWSPDGQYILFASNREGDVQLYTVNADSGRPVRLNQIDGLRGRSDWSSAGQIATYAGDAWAHEILIMNSDGTDVRTITDGGNNLAPSFSPDGEWIAFTSYRDHAQDEQGCEIYIMRRDGSDVRRLTDNDYCDWQPRWGPAVESEE